MGKPEVFSKNLRMLTALKGLKATTACRAIQAMLEKHGEEQMRTAGPRLAKEVGKSLAEIRQNPVDPKWYRRLMQRGVSRASKTTWRHMDALGIFFGIAYEDMWDETLPNGLTYRDQTSNQSPTSSTIYARKLIELLERGEGKYEYLKSLLDSLHGELFSRRARKK